MALVSQHIPKQTHQDKQRALHLAAQHLLSKGMPPAWQVLMFTCTCLLHICCALLGADVHYTNTLLVVVCQCQSVLKCSYIVILLIAVVTELPVNTP